MPSLAELQQQFIDGLTSKNKAIYASICDKKLSAETHLYIYQSSIFGVKQKALREIYAVCEKLVGEAFFVAMINEYIPKHMSGTPDLADYGDHFPDFISHYAPANSLPYLADMARLEWAWHHLFSAPDTDGIDFQALAKHYAEAPEKIIFSLPPHSTCIASPYPLHRIWEVNQDDFKGDQTVVLPENEMFYFFVCRNGLEMRIDLLARVEWQLLTWIKERCALEILCAKVNDEFPDANFEDLLLNSVRRGWLSGFEIVD